MRVIAGKFRSRHLKSFKGLALRPTSDRTRETLFNVLSPLIEGARFLDLFAGTGAVGIEALSRGAAGAVFVESHAPAAKLIRENLVSLGICEARVIADDAVRTIEKLAPANQSRSAAFNIVFLDPPYRATCEYLDVLHVLGSSPIVADAGLVVAEHTRKLELPESSGTLLRYRVLIQGDAALTFYRNQNPPASS
jgi:16S rRNA (guanine966-N2)-methyltransferase